MADQPTEEMSNLPGYKLRSENEVLRSRLEAPTLTGARFGKLTVTGDSPKMGSAPSVHVRCDCGVEKPMRVDSVRRATSCGCPMAVPVAAPWVRISMGRLEYLAYGRWRTLGEWSAETGLPKKTIEDRIRVSGRCPEDALTTTRSGGGTFVPGERREAR